MSVKAVIFDMDGVLVEAKEWHYAALNQALNLFGFEINSYDHVTIYDGLPTNKKLEMLSASSNLPPALHEFINKMKQIYTMEFIRKYCVPREIHQEALSKLQNEGYCLALASNSIKKTVDTMMKKVELAPYFEFMLSCEQVSHPKPAPDIYEKAIQELGLKPSECLVVEDHEYGVQAAKAAGANVMIVKTLDDVNYSNIKANIARIEANNLREKTE